MDHLLCGCDIKPIHVMDVTNFDFWKFISVFGTPQAQKKLSAEIIFQENGNVFLRDETGNHLFCPQCRKIT